MLSSWLKKLSKLRVDRASKSPAPHKPLLLLAILDQIEEGVITSKVVKLTPELAFRFLGYWEAVSSRGRIIGRVELPFFYLQSDGFLRHIAVSGLEDALRSIRPTSVELLSKVILHAELPDEFFALMQVQSNRDVARKTLISGDWFLPQEKIKLLAMQGFELGDSNSDNDSNFFLSEEKEFKQGRNIKFRLQIVPIYRYSCALCGIKVLLPSGITLVEAAHIHQYAHSKNNDITNGMALCRNHHWAFDHALWSVQNDFTVIVALNKFAEQAPNQTGLIEYHLKKIDFSWLQIELRPSQINLNWHRSHVFLGY